MIDAVSGAGFNALAYLNQIKGVAAPANNSPAAAAPARAPSAPPTPPASSPSSSPAPAISPDVLALLQGVSSSSANGGLLSTLMGGGAGSSSNRLSGLYGVLLAQDTSIAPLQSAIANTPPAQRTPVSQVTDLLHSVNSGINAYNQTLLQNAQSVLKVNNGVLPQTA